MKKLILINLVACAVLAVILLVTMNEKTGCDTQCCSSIKNMKPEKIRMVGGGETEEQLFPFNRVFIKI